MSSIVLIVGHKQSYPHGDDQSTMKKKGKLIMTETVQNQRNTDVCAHAAIEMIYHGIIV